MPPMLLLDPSQAYPALAQPQAAQEPQGQVQRVLVLPEWVQGPQAPQQALQGQARGLQEQLVPAPEQRALVQALPEQLE